MLLFVEENVQQSFKLTISFRVHSRLFPQARPYCHVLANCSVSLFPFPGVCTLYLRTHVLNNTVAGMVASMQSTSQSRLRALR